MVRLFFVFSSSYATAKMVAVICLSQRSDGLRVLFFAMSLLELIFEVNDVCDLVVLCLK